MRSWRRSISAVASSGLADNVVGSLVLFHCCSYGTQSEATVTMPLTTARKMMEPRITIRGLRARPLAPAMKTNFDAKAEARFIEEVLGRSGLRAGDIDLVICCANGDSKEDGQYRAVLECLGEAAGAPLAHGVFQHGTGNFHTAAAVGVALGIKSVPGQVLPDRIRCVGPAPGTDLRYAIVYSLYSSGFHSVCLVTA